MTTLEDVEAASRLASRLFNRTRGLLARVEAAVPFRAVIRQPDDTFREMFLYGLFDAAKQRHAEDFTADTPKDIEAVNAYYAKREAGIRAQLADESLREKRRLSAERSRLLALSEAADISRGIDEAGVAIETLYLFDAAAAGKVPPAHWDGAFYPSVHSLIFPLAADCARVVTDCLSRPPRGDRPWGATRIEALPPEDHYGIPLGMSFTINSERQPLGWYDFNARLATERGLAIGEVMRAAGATQTVSKGTAPKKPRSDKATAEEIERVRAICNGKDLGRVAVATRLRIDGHRMSNGKIAACLRHLKSAGHKRGRKK